MNPFIRKLRHGPSLTENDEELLTKIAEPVRHVERGDIVSEGTEPRSIVLVMQGWACRYKQLENGKRQITSIFLPGDLCEPFGALPPLADYSLAALTPVQLVLVPPNALRSAAKASFRIEEVLWWDLLLADALHREHVVSLGRRNATERLGHFFCEVHLRLGMVELVENLSCDMPLTQSELADLFGLSTVHVNRSLQEMRSSGLLSLHGRRLTLHDIAGLREMSMFDPTYLPLSSQNGRPKSRNLTASKMIVGES